MRIRKQAEVVKEALQELADYQNGIKSTIDTGYAVFDEADLPLMTGSIVLIAGASGSGKSYMLQQLKNNIMKSEQAKDYVWFDNSLEMRYFNTMLRDLKTNLKKSKRKIVKDKFTKDEIEDVRGYKVYASDDRFEINEDSFTPEEFEREIEPYLIANQDKKAVFITIDHLALIKNKNSEKKNSIDDFVEMMIRFKKKYPNTIWIPLCQLNRDILKRKAEKTRMSFPERSDIYNTDTVYQGVDWVVVIVNAMALGITEYGKVSADMYDYLSEHFVDTAPDKNNNVSFDTYGRIFYHKLKDREGDAGFRNIYIDTIEDIPPRKQLVKPIEKDDFFCDPSEAF